MCLHVCVRFEAVNIDCVNTKPTGMAFSRQLLTEIKRKSVRLLDMNLWRCLLSVFSVRTSNHVCMVFRLASLYALT